MAFEPMSPATRPSPVWEVGTPADPVMLGGTAAPDPSECGRSFCGKPESHRSGRWGSSRPRVPCAYSTRRLSRTLKAREGWVVAAILDPAVVTQRSRVDPVQHRPRGFTGALAGDALPLDPARCIGSDHCTPLSGLPPCRANKNWMYLFEWRAGSLHTYPGWIRHSVIPEAAADSTRPNTWPGPPCVRVACCKRQGGWWRW